MLIHLGFMATGMIILALLALLANKFGGETVFAFMVFFAVSWLIGLIAFIIFDETTHHV